MSLARRPAQDRPTPGQGWSTHLWHRSLDHQAGEAPLDPARLRTRVALAARIVEALEDRQLSQRDAARLLGTTQPRVSDLYQGRLGKVSERRLIEYLMALGHDIELHIQRGRGEPGQWRVSSDLQATMPACPVPPHAR